MQKNSLNWAYKAFSDPKRPAYGQVATVDSKGHPHVRTVHIHYIPDLNVLTFNTHIESEKWKHLQKNPFVEGCYLDAFRNIQFRFEAKTKLIEPNNKKYAKLLDRMWLSMRPDVRKAYWLDYVSVIPIRRREISQRCPNLGTVLCTPFKWGIYEINETNYLKGKITKYELKNKKWHSQKVSLVRGN